MPSDKWQSEEGLIALGPMVSFLKAGGTINKGDAVKADTTTDLQVLQSSTAADKLFVGIALKAAVSGDNVSLLTKFKAVVKLKIDITAGAITNGTLLQTSATAGQLEAHPAPDAPATYVEADMQTELNKLDERVVGMALQSAAADGDEILVGLL